MQSPKSGSNHPKPWMEETKKVSVSDLEEILCDGGPMQLPSRAMDEVYPGIYIGEHGAAVNVLALKECGFTHVLNAAQGKTKYHSDTNHVMYDKVGIKFMGIEADDKAMFNLMPLFEKTSKYIHTAVKSGGKILVHCKVGASRSATLVLAYLMMKEGKSVTDATRMVRAKREIAPNNGFLRQLCNLQEQIESGELEKGRRCILS